MTKLPYNASQNYNYSFPIESFRSLALGRALEVDVAAAEMRKGDDVADAPLFPNDKVSRTDAEDASNQ